jgi:signal transduction histidine kinase
MTRRGRVDLLLDAAFAALLCAVGLAEIWVPFESAQGSGSEPATSLVVVVMTASLALRRLAPLPVATSVLLVMPVAQALAPPLLLLFWGQFVPMVVAVFSVARHGTARAGAYGGLLAAGTLLLMDIRIPELRSPGELFFHWTVFVLAWSVGRGLRVMEQRAAESQRRAIEAEVAGVERAMAAVMEERARIARELHDIVAHSVSTMVVQAGAAEQVVVDDPEQVRRALHAIRSTGREALSEMRRLVVVLREHEEAGGLDPQPGIAQLTGLLDGARDAGLDVRLSVQGRQRPLPAGLDLAAYRVVQEALTNVRRHAAAAAVDVRLAWAQDALELSVEDDGRGSGERDPLTSAGGHGLVGMRERVALYGGSLMTGDVPAPGRGYRVHAVLPVPPEATA